ncbi:MFS transporter [Actinomadura sp. NTSP31]
MTGFEVVLDSHIVILALPSTERDLGTSAGAGQWVLSVYMLAFGGLLLFGGRLADLLGRRRVFIMGTVLFMVSSLLCAAGGAPRGGRSASGPLSTHITCGAAVVGAGGAWCRGSGYKTSTSPRRTPAPGPHHPLDRLSSGVRPWRGVVMRVVRQGPE